MGRRSNTEIHKFNDAVRAEHDIAWLDVTVEHPGGMRRLQGSGHGDDDAADIGNGGLAKLNDPLLGIAAVNVFQNQKRRAIPFDQVMEVHDVFVGNLPEELRLPAVPLEKTRLVHERVGEHFNGELIRTAFCPKDPTHVAGSELLNNFIRPDLPRQDITAGPVESVGYEMGEDEAQIRQLVAQLVVIPEAQPCDLALRDRHNVGIARLPVQERHFADDMSGFELGQFDASPAHHRVAVLEKIQAIAGLSVMNKRLPGRDHTFRQPGAQLSRIGFADLTPKIKSGRHCSHAGIMRKLSQKCHLI